MKKTLNVKETIAKNENINPAELRKTLQLVDELKKIGIKPRTYSLNTGRTMTICLEVTEENPIPVRLRPVKA